MEIDKRTGRHLAYYINSHPGETGALRLQDEERVLAMNMIHLFCRTRANQTRGVPEYYHSIIVALRDIGEIVDSERVSFRVASCLAALHIRKSFSAGDRNRKSQKIQRLTPGMIMEGQQGDDLKIIDPKRPGQHFAPAMRTLLQSVAVGANMSYATISGDYEGPNFSAQRLDKIGEIRGYECDQFFIIDDFCQRVSDEILKLEFLKGNAPDPDTVQVEWVPEGFEWVDPDKDVKAAIKLNKNLLESKKRIARKRGQDIETIQQEIAEEQEREKELGIFQEADLEAGDGDV